MAHDQAKKLKLALTKIESQNLLFIEDVCAFTGISKDTFYRWWPVGSDGYERIQEALENRRIITKASIRVKLHKSSKAAELLSLYRMICSDEERRAISLQNIEIDSKSKVEVKESIDWSMVPEDALRALLAAKKAD